MEQKSFGKSLGFLIAGAVIGAFGIVISLLAMWDGSAKDLAKDTASTAVVSALTPICVARASDDAEFTVRVATLTDARSSERDDVLKEFGWLPIPEGGTASRNLVTACFDAIVEASKPAT